MTVDISLLSLTALAETGLARIRLAEKLSSEAAEDAAQHEEQVKAAIVAGARQILPKSLGNYVFFGLMHKPQSQYHEDWNCVCFIEIAEWAPIEIRLEVKQPSVYSHELADYNPEKLIVQAWDSRTSNDWLHVLVYDIRYDSDAPGGYYLFPSTRRGYSDITLALAEARKTGDLRPALHEEAIQTIAKRKIEALAEEIPQPSTYSQNIAIFREEFPDANTSEKLLSVIAASLINIAEALEKITKRL